MSRIEKDLPKTLEQAVDHVILCMSERDRERLANMPQEDLITLHSSLGEWIRNALGLGGGNEELLKACGSESLQPDAASMVIIREAWKRLRSN